MPWFYAVFIYIKGVMWNDKIGRSYRIDLLMVDLAVRVISFNDAMTRII